MTGLMRKHGKLLLAVIGSLLMIVFVLPTGQNRDTNAASYVRGTLNGKKVTNADLSPSNTDIQVLRRFGFATSFRGEPVPVSLLELLVTGKPIFGSYYLPGLPRRLPLTPNDELTPTHWYLLLKEAHSYGIVAADSEVTEIISYMKLTEAQMDERLKNLGIGIRTLRNAVADALIIGKLGQLTMNSTQVSLPEVEFRANQGLAKIQVAYATLDAARDGGGWEKSPEPSDDQVK
jgi:hypothetical protein